MLTLGYPLASSGLQGGIALSQGLKKFQDDVGCPTKDPSGFPQAIKKGGFSFSSPSDNGLTIMLRYKRRNLPGGIVFMEPWALLEDISCRTGGPANRYPGAVGLNGQGWR